jgi:tryptophanyl-tRNA synthetase
MTKVSKPVILTGLRANNNLHIGNYFGALLPLIDQIKTSASKHQVNLFVPDLHSITTDIDYDSLQKNILNNLRTFAAAGLPLDNQSVKLYRQSHIPAHSELTVLLNNFTGVGEMNRMTQYKDKAKKIGDDRVSVGLFDYPVMMAADILLYGAEYIPVGEDQTQHLEFTRDIAQRMNKKFGDLFKEPKPVKDQHAFFEKDQGLRIKDLVDPGKKMSKSDESDKGIIFLNDKPETAAKKIMSAATDSLNKVAYDPANQPGVSNLLTIHGLINGIPAASAAKGFSGQTKYSLFKQQVADSVAKFLEEFQAAYSKTDTSLISKKLEESEKEMNEVANNTLLRVQKAVGLR